MPFPRTMIISKGLKHQFHKRLLAWFKDNKRSFSWRCINDPYKVLISEILLQKTNVEKVTPVFKAFINKYPSPQILQNASPQVIQRMIKNLGLMYRAERLISIGKHLSDYHAGKVPSDKDELLKIRGVGHYAASAVRCFAFNKREAIVDTNIVRLFDRVFGCKSLKKRPREDAELWQFAESLLPSRNVRDYNYALLDFSALVCTAKKPRHEICPLKDICKYYNQKTAKKRKPVGIDLFSGAGGLSLGFVQAGFVIQYAVESDKYATETYRNNRSTEVFVDVRDICEIRPKEILRRLGLKKGELDIIIGGPPCQGFSTSNMRTRNLENPKNHLVFKFVEFVRGIKPKWFLMENVAGLDSFENGSIRGKLIEIFHNMGYKTKGLVLNAVNFGVPQNRNRIFFIGNRVGIQMDFIHTIRNTKIKKPITVFDAISDLPKLANGHSVDIMPYNGRKKKLTDYQRRMRKGMNGRVSNNLLTKNNDLSVERFKHIEQGENLISLAKKAPHLVANYKDMDNCHHWIYLRLPWNKPSVTLNNYRKNMLIHPTEDRGLSVREAARLQSFPDNYVFYGSIGFQQQQVANAVPPQLAYKIAVRLLKGCLNEDFTD